MSQPWQRIPRVEFFAVLPAGAWILASVTFAWLAGVDYGGQGSFGQRITPILDFATKPVVAVAGILVTYLLGHIPRAMGLELADRVSVNWFRLWAAGPPDKEQHWKPVSLLGPFPYRRMFERTLRNVVRATATFRSVEHPDGLTPRVFTYHELWKTVVRQNSPDGYAHLESLEARARMYAALFWAGVFGALCGVATLVTLTPKLGSRQALWPEVLPAACLTAFVLFGHWRSQCERWHAEQLSEPAPAVTSEEKSEPTAAATGKWNRMYRGALLCLRSWRWGVAAILPPAVIALASWPLQRIMSRRLAGLACLFGLVLLAVLFAWRLARGAAPFERTRPPISRPPCAT